MEWSCRYLDTSELFRRSPDTASLEVDGVEVLVPSRSPVVIDELSDPPVLEVKSAPRIRVPGPPPLPTESISETNFQTDYLGEFWLTRTGLSGAGGVGNGGGEESVEF